MLCVGVVQGPWLGQGPNGFHKWRESDTAAVAANLAFEEFDLLRPRVDQRGMGNGITGMEFPLYNSGVALLWRTFGYSHLWARLLSLASLLVLSVALGRLTLHLGQNLKILKKESNDWAMAAVFAVCFAPLGFFYSQKIQPDMLGLACSILGFLFFVQGEQRTSFRGPFLLAGALFLALAGLIKPTFLVVGAPMAVFLVQRHGIGALARPRNVAVAASALAPVFGWLYYARWLSESEGNSHFYLGGDGVSELSAAVTGPFYQNVFLTWPWELQAGFILSPFALAGIYQLRRHKIGSLLGVWIAGCLLIFILTAQHCATSHDYYGLPMVPPLAMAGGYGIVAAYRWVNAGTRRSFATRMAVFAAFLALAIPTAFLRVSGRYGESFDFAAGRKLFDHMIPKDARVLAIDDTPSVLLYRSGRKGLNLMPHQVSSELIAQYRYLVSFERFEKSAQENVKRVGNLEFLFRDQGIAAYRLTPQNHQSMNQ